MSLKVVHIVIILLSIALTLFFGFWAINDYSQSKNTANLYWGIASLVSAAVLIPYLIWFFTKMKRAGLK